LGQVFFGWSNLTEMSLQHIFDGSPEAITLLTTVISDGKMIQGGGDPPVGSADTTTLAQLTADISKALFAFAIPAIWPLASTFPFVLDSGYNCGDGAALDTVADDVKTLTGGCYNGKQYYLVWPTGKTPNCVTECEPHCGQICSPGKFSAPPGLDTLDGTRFGGVTVTDLIAGSVRTYIQNGNINGGAATDPTNDGSLNELINVDVTTPGFIRIPVCSSDIAHNAWTQGVSTSSPNYPCFVKPSISDCGASSFTDQTSDASPTVDDCMGIVHNIENTQGEWEVENAVESQHMLVQFGKCKFGVQGKKINGNIDFHLGAQDIVDIINSSIEMFGGSGKVGAKGTFDCKGDVSTVPVQWGLY
jgi:hypothetical protein